MRDFLFLALFFDKAIARVKKRLLLYTKKEQHSIFTEYCQSSLFFDLNARSHRCD